MPRAAYPVVKNLDTRRIDKYRRRTSLSGIGRLSKEDPFFRAADNASMAYMIPMFFYEVPLGLWFLIKGVTVPTVKRAASSG